MNRPLTIGNRAPQIKMSEKDKMRPILFEIFSCRGIVRSQYVGTYAHAAYMCASVEALCTVTSVQEEGLVLLD